jgi:hypothetical protein
LTDKRCGNIYFVDEHACSLITKLPAGAASTGFSNGGFSPMGIRASGIWVIDVALIVANFTAWLVYGLPNGYEATRLTGRRATPAMSTPAATSA